MKFMALNWLQQGIFANHALSVLSKKFKTNLDVKTMYPNDVDRELPDLHHGQLGALVIFILGYIRIA